MRFNPKARLDTSRVRDGGRGGGGGGTGGMGGGQMRIPMPGGTKAGGGIGLVVIVVVILLLKACGGIDLTGALNGAAGGYDPSRFQGDSAAYAGCTTGQDANDHPTTCGVVAVENSLVDYWQGALSQQSNASFQPEAAIVTFSSSISTGCGQASSGMGPFYCPNDQTIYFDPTFFHDILQQQLNGPSGAFVEPYVVAHEFGHHIQNLLGTMNKVKTQQGPNSDSVRLELQADCYAGMWTKDATTTKDAQGNVLIQDLSQQDIQDAIAAAKSVGDDTIQKETTGKVIQDQWTHGSSAARVKWFMTGYQNGTLSACDTFSVPTVE
ncbi:MAG TPA: neutral zinc metallopeptidase [Nocardioides sp.]|jgi:predicted metalloprotease|nr:neutral zinc metallopeptidase [Nocardioides sp.]